MNLSSFEGLGHPTKIFIRHEALRDGFKTVKAHLVEIYHY